MAPSLILRHGNNSINLHSLRSLYLSQVVSIKVITVLVIINLRRPCSWPCEQRR